MSHLNEGEGEESAVCGGGGVEDGAIVEREVPLLMSMRRRGHGPYRGVVVGVGSSST
jgi:hypothetical protein